MRFLSLVYAPNMKRKKVIHFLSFTWMIGIWKNFWLAIVWFRDVFKALDGFTWNDHEPISKQTFLKENWVVRMKSSPSCLRSSEKAQKKKVAWWHWTWWKTFNLCVDQYEWIWLVLMLYSSYWFFPKASKSFPPTNLCLLFFLCLFVSFLFVSFHFFTFCFFF
jgi:hypothetical protein